MQWMVVGVDGSENSRRALEWAFEEARLRNARLEVVHVWKTPHMVPYELTAYNTKACEEAARRLLDEMVPERPSVEPVAVEKILVRGSAARGRCSRPPRAPISLWWGREVGAGSQVSCSGPWDNSLCVTRRAPSWSFPPSVSQLSRRRSSRRQMTEDPVVGLARSAR